MTEIYLIRHSQAQGNRYRMLQGSWDGEITEKGKRQIEALARRFSGIRIDAVYSSDLRRAVLTAQAAARRDRLPIRTRTELRELNTGPWERRFFGNISYEQPELARRFLYDAENWRLEGAETCGEVRGRSLTELKRIAEENDGKTVAVVSHGVTIRCIMSGITGLPLSDTERLPIFKNTSVTKLLWDREQFHIVYMNDSSHLPAETQSSWDITGDLRDVPFDPERDGDYYKACYADAWESAHGSLCGLDPEIYFRSAVHHAQIQPGAVLRMYHGETPVGLVDLDPERASEESVGWISLLYLNEDYRNRGYGIQLLARAVFFYLDLGRRKLRLLVAEENQIARAFYEREGFRKVGEQRASNGKLLLMERAPLT